MNTLIAISVMVILIVIPNIQQAEATKTKPSARARSSPRSREVSPGKTVPVATSTSTSNTALPAAASAPMMDAVSIAKLRIKEESPTISDRTLRCDEGVVNDALPLIKSKFEEKGFEEIDAIEAVADGWVTIRSKSRLRPSQCMVQTSFQDYVGDLGKMLFRSDPDHAAIELSGKPLNEETSKSRWLEPNTYNVKYTKEGKQAEKQCVVKTKQVTDCFATLQ